jgi:hypothetical protein
MSDAPHADRPPFEGGPPSKLLRCIGLIRDDRPQVVRRALIAIAVMWLPLVVLAGVRGDLIGRGGWNPFLADFGAQARFLLVPPLLIFAELFCMARLNGIAAHFRRASLVIESDYPRYDYAVSSTIRLMNATWVEIVAFVLAYILVATLWIVQPIADLPGWHGLHTGSGFAFSPAGWWAALVSLPLLVVLELGWLWRLCLWTRFLWLMNGLSLRLLAAHPDHAAGLRFVEYSLRAFLPLGFVIGVLAAGPVLNLVVHQNVAPLQFKFLIAGTAILAAVVLAGPLLIFIHRLLEEQNRGGSAYGTLALRMGEQFEDRWFYSGVRVNKEVLSVSDFSSTTDLYSIVANVYAMQILPFQLKNLLLLIAVTLLPFAPIALLSVPLEVILQKLAGLFL